MKNLTLTLEEEVNILSKYRITSNELMFIRTLLLLQEEENEDLFQSYIESLHDCDIKLRDMILCLQDKGVILKNFKIPSEGSPFDPYSIPFNKNFIKNIYKSSFEMGKELFEVYPQFGVINGASVPLRTVARHFDSLEDAYFRYGRSIRWNEERHNHIIELVNWAREQGNIISSSLSSFIINNGWIDLDAIRNGDSGNINYNAIKMI